ncbi:50S ribosomal protein L23 [Porphyridium purpureum]|uniref:Large ribosomal subunit protein uL23m n=1 Tax=Porphyridium purpureum TaxID=35688 RepID=A0A5J4Z739_PORPP|nr:50S ribosomal protein L23 [Porphyridium purpureum]|eukprot:POR6719..scf295_1
MFPNLKCIFRLQPPPGIHPGSLLPNDTFVTDTLIFEVDRRLTKVEVKLYLEAMYNLDIVKVNTLVQYGKLSKRHGKWHREKDVKKAYVFLREAVTLPSRPRPFSEWVTPTPA